MFKGIEDLRNVAAAGCGLHPAMHIVVTRARQRRPPLPAAPLSLPLAV